MSMALSTRSVFKTLFPWAAVALCLILLLASLFLHDTLFHGRVVQASPTHAAAAAAAPAPAAATTLTLPEGKWKVAGIQTEPMKLMALPSEVGVAGKIEVNPDHRVDIRPRASGIVREVQARLGQKVKKGDVLAILDSADLGTARLNLRSRQIELGTAQVERDWKQQIADNVARLIPQLNKGVPADTIRKEYADRPLGSDRALLLQAYAEFEIASHEAEKTSGMFKEKLIGEHPALVAMHAFEGSQAKLQGIIEQVTNDAKLEIRVADQKVRLAEFAVIDAAQRLRILGVPEDIAQSLAQAIDITSSRPSIDEDVTAYHVIAPFDGTIIDKRAVPSQKADPGDVLFMLADMRTVWVMANITESDLAILPTLKDGMIRLTTTAYPGRTFQARLLSVGAQVDPTTRTVPLLAETPNPDDLLKGGMFAQIVLDAPSTQEVPTVPVAAAVEIDGRSGVFVPSGKDGRTFTFRPVKLGRVADGRQVILGGLARGDTVVSTNAYFLKSELILQNEPDEE